MFATAINCAGWRPGAAVSGPLDFHEAGEETATSRTPHLTTFPPPPPGK